jgi:hypothetical protein
MNMCGSGIMHMEGVLLAAWEKHEKDKMTKIAIRMEARVVKN